jgi:hypothetical protein
MAGLITRFCRETGYGKNPGPEGRQRIAPGERSEPGVGYQINESPGRGERAYMSKVAETPKPSTSTSTSTWTKTSTFNVIVDVLVLVDGLFHQVIAHRLLNPAKLEA